MRPLRPPSHRASQKSQSKSKHPGEGLVRVRGEAPDDLTPNVWRSETFEYTFPEGGKGTCKRCKRPIHPSLSEKQSDWREPCGKSIAQVARDLGISDTRVHQWRKELAEHGPEAFPGSGHQTAQEEEVRRLKRELEMVKQERDILRKALGTFRAARNEVSVHSGRIGTSIPLRSCAMCWRCRPSGTMPGASGHRVGIAEKMPSWAPQVKMAFQANRRVYGSPRIHAELQAQGIHCAKAPGGSSHARARALRTTSTSSHRDHEK